VKLLLKCKYLIDATDGQLRKDIIIEVQDGSIKALHGSENTIDQDDHIIDFQDLTVMPGLIDCHDHLGLDVGDEKAQCSEQSDYIAIKGVRVAKQLINAGITTLRDVGEKDFIDVSWRRAIQEGVIDGPRMLISGQPIVRTGGHGWFLGIEIDGVSEALKAVRRQLKSGVDLVKIMIGGGMTTENSSPLNPELTREEVNAVVNEAHRAGKKVAAHVHGGDGADLAIEAGVDSIEHGVYLTREQLRRMAEKNIFLVVTYGVLNAIIMEERAPQFAKDKILKVKDNYNTVIEQAKKEGVNIAVGGDTYHAKTFEELKALVESGISPMHAIRCATINGARLCGIDSVTGTIEVGKDADIIAVQGNPLQDISAIANVKYVIKQGKVVKSPNI